VEKLLTLAEAGEAVQISTYTLRRWARIGRLPSVRLGPRSLRFRAADLEGFIKRSVRPAREPQR
jgi:excisionase family DNA binding protein